MTVFDTFPWPQSEMGSAPAPGVADCALAVGTGAHASGATNAQPPHSPAPPKGCREGAATDTPGACAPQTLAQLLALNQQVAANIERGSLVTAPGGLPNYPDAKQLVTEDCIRPAQL